MFSTLCLLIFVFFSSGDATIPKIITDTIAGGGFDFGINGRGWGSGIAGSTAGRGGIGGGLTFGYTTSGLKIPFLPVIYGDQSRYPGQNNNQQQGNYHPQGQGGFPQQGQGYLPQGQVGYSQPGQAGNPIQGIPQHGIGYPSYGIGGFPTHGANPVGIIPQGGNVGGFAPHSGFPHQGGQGNNFPLAGQGSYIPQGPQTGYPSQGGYIPQVPHGVGSYSGQGLGGDTQPGTFGLPDEPAVIDPRKRGEARPPTKPTSQGRRRTISSTPKTEENTPNTESPAISDEESFDENAIPEEKDEK